MKIAVRTLCLCQSEQRTSLAKVVLYQFNLASHLVPVPLEMYRDRGFGLRYLPLRIEDDKGTLLGHLQFIPWQDGGVIRVIGRLPLAAFLVYLGQPIVKDAQRIERSDGEMSSVLPIGQAQFREMVGRFQRQSNMTVKPEQPSWIVSKFADEGSGSPFMARLFLGNVRLRDVVFPEKNKREVFDKPYEFVLMTILNTRATAQEIIKMLSEHKRKVSAGQGVRLTGHVIHVDESIDRELRKNVEEFLTSAVRVLKQGMQEVTRPLQLDIGFLFRDQPSFEKGIANTLQAHPKLAAYLVESRKWSEKLVLSRNALEHGVWLLPKIGYKESAGAVQPVEPQIEGQSVSDFVELVMDRLCCFVEEVTAYALQSQMPSDFSITEIPLAERSPECQERFQLALALGGMPVWSLVYHASKFEET